MNARGLEALSRLELKTGLGVYVAGEDVVRAGAARTVLGLRPVALREDGRTGPGLVERLKALALTALYRGLAATRPLLERFSVRVPRLGAASRDPVNLVVGVRPSAVNFSSEPLSEAAALPAGGEAGEQKPARGRRKAGPVVGDQLVVPLGRGKARLSARVRTSEIERARQAAGLGRDSENRFEPAPWAAWRASLYYAPLKPSKGIHLRFLLGDGEGLAILASGRWPLAWQVLSWQQDNKHEVLLQAFRLLQLHATRRLGLGGIEHVSVQGNNHLSGGWDALAEAIERPVQHVDGPSYEPEMVAFGLALGALAPKEETIDLAASLRDEPPLYKLVPWGEVSFGVALFLCMFLVMSHHAASLRGELAETTSRIAHVEWAKDLQIAKLKSQAAALEREVTPLEKFMERQFTFSRAFASVAEVMPEKTWLVVAEGKDLLWEKNPNKALGEHYLLLDTGVPNTSGDTTPPEINETVRRLERDSYLGRVLPRAKLVDVTWRQEGGNGFTVFTVLLKPKK